MPPGVLRAADYRARSGRGVTSVKYRTSSAWTDDVEAVEVIRESPKMVVIRERAAAGGWVDSTYQKRSAHFCLHETAEAAYAYLICRLEDMREQHLAQVEQIDDRLKLLRSPKKQTLQ